MDKIVLYSTGCPRCQSLKTKLNLKHIEFEERKDIEEMKGLGISTVPTLIVDGQKMDFTAAMKWASTQEKVNG